MPKYKKWYSGCVKCPRCDWIYLPHTKDWEWHNKNCKYMAGVKGRIVARRKEELKERHRSLVKKQ